MILREKRSTVLRKILFSVGALFAALALVLAFTVPASASSDGPELCNPTVGSCVWFTNNGDVIHVADTACDNHAAVAQVQVTDGVSIHDNLWNHAGCGTTLAYSYGASVPEGAVVYYRPCLGNSAGTGVQDCNSGWTHGVA